MSEKIEFKVSWIFLMICKYCKGKKLMLNVYTLYFLLYKVFVNQTDIRSNLD